MELKLAYTSASPDTSTLLIVPYGIETKYEKSGHDNPHVLLIVPYGIETSDMSDLLHHISLLIVPYGIETSATEDEPLGTLAFNRTLWN